MKAKCYSTLVLILINLFPAYSQTSIDSMRKEINRAMSQVRQVRSDAADAIEQEYDDYIAKIRKEYDDFVTKIEQSWGEGNATMSDKRRWAEYSDDRSSRSIVDFEKGEAKIEVLLSNEELKDDEIVTEKLRDATVQLLESKGNSVEYKSEYIKQENLSDNEIMSGLIATDHSTPELIAEDIVKKEAIEITKLTTSRGDVNIVSITPEMVGDYIYKLAKRYEPEVLSAADRFSVDPSLIFAIIETESYFNPAAASHIPAYGLMQIVPKYAGRDVYKYLYGQDRILDRNYLFQPDNNIEIGVGFLHLLSTKYFKSVTDTNSKELCMIAAYNTGPGNVSRAMAGHTNVFKVAPQINSKTYNELYNHLRLKLPYSETRDYIKKVTTKREKYQYND